MCFIRTVFFWCGVLVSLGAVAQKKSQVEIINADELGFDKGLRGNITVFKGNCIFKQDNVTIRCDSAYFDQANNSFDAFSHVHITQENVNIYGDLLNYDGNIKYAQLFNNIKVTDGEMVLTTENLDYDIKTRLSTYRDGGKVVDKENVLTSKFGYYYAATHDAFFKKNVVLTNPEYLLNADTLRYNTQTEIAYLLGPSRIDGKDDCLFAKYGTYNTNTDQAFFSKDAYYENATQKLKGDSLFYDRQKGKGKAMEHVVFTDTVENITITGKLGNYTKATETTLITGLPLVTLVTENDSASTDSIFFTADTIRTTLDSTQLHRELYAYHDARLYKSDLQARCDSMTYSNFDSLIRCFTKPIIWAENSQMTANYITIQLKNQQLHQLNLYTAAFIISPEADSINFNQVRGKNMYGQFIDNKLRRMLVEGNGQSMYFAREDSGDYIGMNQAECSNMIILFNNNKAESITFITKPDATFFPIDQLPIEQKLKGFKWQIALKPQSKNDLFSGD